MYGEVDFSKGALAHDLANLVVLSLCLWWIACLEEGKLDLLLNLQQVTTPR